jgi:hypothetical protein
MLHQRNLICSLDLWDKFKVQNFSHINFAQLYRDQNWVHIAPECGGTLIWCYYHSAFCMMSAELKRLPSQHFISLHWIRTVSGSKLSTEPLHVLLTPHILTEELLCSNGFPRPHPEEKGVAIVHLPPGTVKKTPLSPDRKRVLRVCCRCNQGYSVNRDGFQVKDEQCIYHWGRLYQTRGKF